MSRLKGADLGVQLPAGTMNYRGAWSATPSPAYATNDVVLRNGVEYVAVGIPGATNPTSGAGAGAATLVQHSPGSFSSPTFGAATSVANAILVAWMSPNSTDSATPPVAPAGFTLIHDTGTDATLGKRHMYFLAQPGAVASMTATGFTNAGSWMGMAFEFAGPVVANFAADAHATATSLAVSATNPNPSYALVLSGSGLSTNVSNGTVTLITTSGGAAPDTFSFVQPAAANPSYTFTGASSAGILLSMVLVQTPAWQPLVSLATGLMNYRGQWGSGNTYAANDVAVDANLLWLALAAVPSGSNYEPVLNPVYQTAEAGHATGAGTSPFGPGSASVEQAFTTPASGQTVSSIQLTFTGAATGLFRVGIASAVGTVDTGVTWVGATPPVQSAPPPAAGSVVYALPAALSLTASTTYYIVIQALSGAPSATLQGGSTAPSVSGAIASIGAAQINAGAGGSWGATSWHFNVTLGNGSVPAYWQPVSPVVENVNVVAASGAAVTLPDVTTATMHRVTLTANCTITLPTPGAGKSFTASLVQDATGGRTVTWATPSGVIKWPGGTAPVITATANAIDVVSFVCFDGVNWLGFLAGQAFA